MKPANLIDGEAFTRPVSRQQVAADRAERLWLAQSRNWAVVMSPRRSYWMKLGSAPNKEELRIARGIAND